MIAINATWDIPTPCIDPFHGSEPTPLYPAVNGNLRDLLGAPNAILTNPPYKRGLVDELMGQCITLVKDGVIDFSALLRVQWDTAVTRQWMMESPFAGKTIPTFRPWWTAPEKIEQHIQFTIIIGSFGIADTRVSQSSVINGVDDEELLEAALEYRRRGFSPIPLRPGRKLPAVKWKEMQEEPWTEEQIRDYWTVNPDANIGLHPAEQNFLAIDVDG